MTDSSTFNQEYFEAIKAGDKRAFLDKYGDVPMADEDYNRYWSPGTPHSYDYK